ncbi:YrhB domain-containing protein [Undibacterium sp. Ji50W]|uniref:YrhB domain-containing protein n=1 Tax=Undibacterium sp. Ji50W TaxID=3413041 RepID=UPI003BF18D03
MRTFVQARRIAEAWVEIMVGGDCAIDISKTKTKPYGWLFYWNSKKYLADPTNHMEALVGNVPIFVDRVNGEVLLAGPAGIDWFAKYEVSIPPARLLMTPEPAVWDNVA